jgi:Tfp pilus assembly protein PilF
VSHYWNLIMRFSPPVLALSLAFLMASSASVGKKADHDIDARSVALVAEGDAAQKAGDAADAIGWYETALAVDPRNRAAFVALARVSATQGLKGKAIRYYNEALEIEPNDQDVLAAQGELMASKGALDAAKKNLARLQILCRSGCGAVDRLGATIAKAGEKPAVQASAVEIKPTIEKAN